jgi:hypothetical protein
MGPGNLSSRDDLSGDAAAIKRNVEFESILRRIVVSLMAIQQGKLPGFF